MDLELGSLGEIFGTSEDEAENGKWFAISDKISVKVRRATSKRSRRVREILDEPYSKLAKFGQKISEDTQDAINIEHLADGILVDWKGVTSGTGEQVPYSKNAAIYLLTKLPDFRLAVSELAVKLENFRAEKKTEIEGN